MTNSHLADLAAWVVASRHRGQLGSVSANHRTNAIIEQLLPFVYGVKPYLAETAGDWVRQGLGPGALQPSWVRGRVTPHSI